MLLCVCSVFQGCTGLSHMCVFCIECVGISVHLVAKVCVPRDKQLLVCVRVRGVWHSLPYLSDVCYVLLETRRSPGSLSPHIPLCSVLQKNICVFHDS